MDNFTPDNLIGWLIAELQTLPDGRKGKNTRYEVADAGLGAFSVFFTQCPSFLEFQRQMEAATGKSNANSLFAMRAIPKDQQIRRLLDEAPADILFPVFDKCLNTLKETGEIKQFVSELGYLIAFDGTQTVSSPAIHCETCLKKKDTQGKLHYYHNVLTPVIVTLAGRVLPLTPEYISNKDGTTKQDCENAAAKRCLEKHGKQYASLKAVLSQQTEISNTQTPNAEGKTATILGDDLYSRQPVIKAIQEQLLHFILVCKRESHKYMYEYIDALEEGDTEDQIKTVVTRERYGNSHMISTYRFFNNVPLIDSEDSILVNWVEITQTREKDRKILYYNTFVTDHHITKDNAVIIASCGRTRWKVENENNNTLKTKGYHFEHNYGHGEKYLANFLTTLILIAFMFHILLDLFFEPFILLKAKFTRLAFFNAIRTLTQLFYCNSWDHLFSAMKYGLEKGLPLPMYPFAVLPSG